MMKNLSNRLLRKALAFEPAYRFFSLWAHHCVSCDAQSVGQARERLTAFSPDPDCSAVWENVLPEKREYDVQIIVPAYNVARFLPSCIESVLRLRTAYRVLLTVVNDGSTDATAELLKSYEGREHVLILTQENRGFSGARNRGLRNLRARYVMFLDADDELMELDALMHRALETGADIVEGGYEAFDDAGVRYTVRHERLSGEDARRTLYGYPWGKLFRADLFTRVCFPEKYWFEDSVMTFLLYPMSRVVVTDDALVYRYRLNPEGISARSRNHAKILDCYWITARLLRDRETLGLSNDRKFAEVILREFCINEIRLSETGNRQLEQDVFRMSVALWKEFFPSCLSDHPLVHALQKQDFGAYRLLCLYYDVCPDKLLRD